MSGAQLVGKYVYLYVPCDNIYMKAKVCKYSSNRNLHCVEYTADKEREAISMEKVTWELCGSADPDFKPLSNTNIPRNMENSPQNFVKNITTNANNTKNINNIIKKPQCNGNIFQLKPQQQQLQQQKQQQILILQSRDGVKQEPHVIQPQQQLQQQDIILVEKGDQIMENVLSAAYLRIEQLQNMIKNSREEISLIRSRHQIRKSELTNTISMLQEKMSAMEEEEVELKASISELQQEMHDMFAAQQLKAFQNTQNGTVIPIKQQGWANGQILPNVG
eukprot:TRINITY_DN23068_c0_g1_i6.p2 TRINITY_DN23068_c0_g1~~TRINITY_DN23068_c0_g1_i6.p2  ORF type:complete len:277 (-),score=34.74 TRINITY_DN23068_c0_g1_i6:326-1156(-)